MMARPDQWYPPRWTAPGGPHGLGLYGRCLAGSRRSAIGNSPPIVFSNGSRAEGSSGRKALLGIDALGCLCSLRARLALDGVSWVQGGEVENAVGW